MTGVIKYAVTAQKTSNALDAGSLFCTGIDAIV